MSGFITYDRSDFENDYPEISKLYEDISIFAHNAKATFNADPSEEYKIFLATYYGRILEMFEGIFVEGSIGNRSCRQILLRSLIESYIRFVAASKSRECADKIMQSSKIERLNYLKRARSSLKFSLTERQDYDERLKEIQKEIKDSSHGQETLRLWQIANMCSGDEVWLCRIPYGLMCNPTHTDAHDLLTSIDFNEQTAFGIHWGPSYESCEHEMMLAMRIMLKSSIKEPLCISKTEDPAYQDLHFRLAALESE